MLKQTLQLDAIDRRLLQLLQEDGALSHAALADRVGASAASCWRRIRAMEEAGVLTATVRLVDPEKVGQPVNVLCQIRMRSHTPDAREAFEELVRGRPEVIECFSTSGEWDYLLRIIAPDVPGYERFLMRTLLCHPSVLTASSHFALALKKYTTAIPV